MSGPTLADVLDTLERIKAARQTILIHPDDESTVRDALGTFAPELTAGLTIRTSEYLPRGVLFATRTDYLDSFAADRPEAGT